MIGPTKYRSDRNWRCIQVTCIQNSMQMSHNCIHFYFCNDMSASKITTKEKVTSLGMKNLLFRK